MYRRTAPKFIPFSLATVCSAIAAAWLYDAWTDPSGYLREAGVRVSGTGGEGDPLTPEAEGSALEPKVAADALAAVVQRNLFSTDRQPPSRMIAETPPGGPSHGDAVTEEPPRLTGIVVTPDMRRALVRDEDTGAARVLKPGDTMGSWRLRMIAGDRVTWTSSGREVTRRFSLAQAAQAARAEAGGAAPRRPGALMAERSEAERDGAGQDGETGAEAVLKGSMD